MAPFTAKAELRSALHGASRASHAAGRPLWSAARRRRFPLAPAVLSGNLLTGVPLFRAEPNASKKHLVSIFAMERNFLLTLAAGAMLLAGCSSPNLAMELKEGKLSVTQEQHFGRPPRAWQFMLVSDKAEMETRLNAGWKLADGEAMHSIHWKREDGEAIKSVLQKAGRAGTILVMREVSLPGTAANAVAPPPFRPMLIATPGTYPSPDGIWKIEVSDDSISFGRAGGGGVGFAPQPNGWRAQKGWFVFTETESRVWAYDGGSRIYLAAFSPSGSAMYNGSFFESPDGDNSSGAPIFRSNFPCAVPAEVISHLPERKQKEMHKDAPAG
jgi:hypothetical protein